MPGQGSGVPVQGAYTWLRLTKESVYGVYDPAGESIYVVLAGDNPFNAQKTLLRTVIRSADTSNRPRNNIQTKYTVEGTFNSPFYPSQAGFMLDMGTTLKPLAPGQPPTIASFTADFFDGQVPRRLTGATCQQMTLNSDADTQYANLAVTMWGSALIDGVLNISSDFPPPGCADLPQDEPFLFNELAGYLLYGPTPDTGAATLIPVTIFDSLNITFANILDRKHYEKPEVAYTQWAGRDVTFSTNLAYLTTEWRDYYEQQKQLTFKATFTRPSGPSCALNFWSKNYVVENPRNHPLAGVVTQGVTAAAFFDCSATPAPTDFSYVFTP